MSFCTFFLHLRWLLTAAYVTPACQVFFSLPRLTPLVLSAPWLSQHVPGCRTDELGDDLQPDVSSKGYFGKDTCTVTALSAMCLISFWCGLPCASHNPMPSGLQNNFLCKPTDPTPMTDTHSTHTVDKLPQEPENGSQPVHVLWSNHAHQPQHMHTMQRICKRICTCNSTSRTTDGQTDTAPLHLRGLL